MSSLLRKRYGFTIIELMVVVLIIGILASIVLVTLEKGKEKSRDAKRKSDLTLIASALEQYHVDKKNYPATPINPTIGYIDYCPVNSLCQGTFSFSSIMATYLFPMPKDPSGWEYYYRSDGVQYKVVAQSEGMGSDLEGKTCDDPEIKAKAGDFCNPRPGRDGNNILLITQLQVSSSNFALRNF